MICSSRINGPLKCCFSVLKAINPIPFQSYEEGCNQSKCSTWEWWTCFPPSQTRVCADQQDLSSGWEKLPLKETPCHPVGAWQHPCSVQGSHWISDPVRRRNHFPGQDAMAPSFCIPSWQLCQILLSPDISFLSMYPQAAKQICIEWHSEVQVLLSVTSTIGWGNLCQSIRMREGDLVPAL